MDRKVAALCEDISNANDELDDLDDEDDDDEDDVAKAQTRQVGHWRKLDVGLCWSSYAFALIAVVIHVMAIFNIMHIFWLEWIRRIISMSVNTQKRWFVFGDKMLTAHCIYCLENYRFLYHVLNRSLNQHLSQTVPGQRQIISSFYKEMLPNLWSAFNHTYMAYWYFGSQLLLEVRNSRVNVVSML